MNSLIEAIEEFDKLIIEEVYCIFKVDNFFMVYIGYNLI